MRTNVEKTDIVTNTRKTNQYKSRNMYLSNKIVINELKQRQSTCRRSVQLFLLLRTSLLLAVFINVPVCSSQETKAMVSEKKKKKIKLDLHACVNSQTQDNWVHSTTLIPSSLQVQGERLTITASVNKKKNTDYSRAARKFKLTYTSRSSFAILN